MALKKRSQIEILVELSASRQRLKKELKFFSKKFIEQWVSEGNYFDTALHDLYVKYEQEEIIVYFKFKDEK